MVWSLLRLWALRLTSCRCWASWAGVRIPECLGFLFFCTERRFLWLARPGRKALARQAFSAFFLCLLSTTTCALAIATLAPTRTQWMLSLSSHTAQRANTWCKPTFSAGAPPSPRWCPNGGTRPHTSGRGAISSVGLSPCPCTPNSQPPPPAEESQHTVMT